MAELSLTTTVSPRIVAAYLTVLRLARERGYLITRVKMAKILYLADLAAVKDGEDPVSGIAWRWLDHGPFDYALQYLENDLVTAGSVRREEYYWGFQLRLLDQPAGYDMPPEDIEILDRTIAEYGNLAAGSLKDLSYQTAPMIDAQERGRGVFLDLSLARPRPRLTDLATRLSAVIRRLPVQETDPGVFQEIERETAGLDFYRREANEAVLPDDQ